MAVIIIDVFKHDNTFFKPKSLKEIRVQQTDGWELLVEDIVKKHFIPRKNYYLSYRYEQN